MPAVTIPTDLSVEDLLALTDGRKLAASGEGRRIRESAGASQSELGAVVGVTNVAISKWEAGTRRPAGAAAIRYARALRALAAG